MKTSRFENVRRYGSFAFVLVAALGGVGCAQGEPVASRPGDIIAEVKIDDVTRLVFVDEGEGRVGVAELSQTGRASILMDMFNREHASPLEIYMAAAGEAGEAEAPEILVENHYDIVALQAREEEAPRRIAMRSEPEYPGFSSAAGWSTSGNTPCTATGWEGPTGAWGDPVDSWANIFTNSTLVLTNNVTYPHAMQTMQMAGWNGGGGSFHSHGACVSKDAGVDKTISFSVTANGMTPPPFALSAKAGETNYVIYNDYITMTGGTMTSSITNNGNASASFRHSAAAWVPNPG